MHESQVREANGDHGMVRAKGRLIHRERLPEEGARLPVVGAMLEVEGQLIGDHAPRGVLVSLLGPAQRFINVRPLGLEGLHLLSRRPDRPLHPLCYVDHHPAGDLTPHLGGGSLPNAQVNEAVEAHAAQLTIHLEQPEPLQLAARLLRVHVPRIQLGDGIGPLQGYGVGRESGCRFEQPARGRTSFADRHVERGEHALRVIGAPVSFPVDHRDRLGEVALVRAPPLHPSFNGVGRDLHGHGERPEPMVDHALERGCFLLVSRFPGDRHRERLGVLMAQDIERDRGAERDVEISCGQERLDLAAREVAAQGVIHVVEDDQTWLGVRLQRQPQRQRSSLGG